MRRPTGTLRWLRRRLAFGADALRNHGACRLVTTVLPWLACRRYVVYARRLAADPPSLPPSDVPLELVEAGERDVGALLSVRPGFCEPAELVQRFSDGARCFLAWSGDVPVHVAWVFTGVVRRPHVGRTLTLTAGQVFSDEVYTASGFRGRGVHARASELLCRVLREEGHDLHVFATPSWDAPSCRSAERRHLTRVGEIAQRGIPGLGGFRFRPRVTENAGGSGYQSFWEYTGRSIPAHSEAPSTRYYRECEQILFKEHFPDLKGKSVFKTDLWDEAKNTRILQWASDRGARVFGLDISLPVAREARGHFAGSKADPGFAVSDLRQIAFADDSFDCLYSMGTIEHFHEHFEAVAECHRVLKKGGIAVIGVPNRCDPFLRPVMVSILYELGLYPYGLEKSFSFRELEHLLVSAGFEILDRTGVLFIPGGLRVVDLFLHVTRPGLTALTAPLVRPFAWLYRRFPVLRPHGYLIACVVRKPD